MTGGYALWPPMYLEIRKTFDNVIIRFLVDEIRSFPVVFARELKTLFIHPEMHRSSAFLGIIWEIHTLCKVYEDNAYSPQLWRLLRQKSAQIRERANHASSSFEELLICVKH